MSNNHVASAGIAGTITESTDDKVATEPSYVCMKCHATKPASKFTMRTGMKRRPRRCDDCTEAAGVK